MKDFSLELWNNECAKTTFYTVRFLDEELSETDKFFLKYHGQPEYKEAVEDLLNFVTIAIGDKHGALDQFFNRYENQVIGLPNRGCMRVADISYHYPGFPLRLYALRVSEKIVILLSGGVKDAQTNQRSTLSTTWILSCEFAKRISKSFSEGIVSIDNMSRELLHFQSGSEIIL